MVADHRIYDLIRLSSRYVIVRDSEEKGAGFALVGHVNEMGDLNDWHSGIENCKPGIWKAIAKETPDELKSSGIILECCLQWVADLDETTSLDLASSVKTWKEWDQKLREKFGEDGVAEPLSKAIVWKEAESYFDDGGLCNVITAEYVTEKGFRKLVHGGKGGDSEDEEDEEDDDEEEEEEEEEDDEDLGSYLEPITLKDWELDVAENGVFTLGGLHFYQDSVGCPPRVATGELDGKVVAVKLFCEDEEYEPGHQHDAQPGNVSF